MDSSTLRRSLRHGIPQVDGSVCIAEPTPFGGNHIRWYYPGSLHAAPHRAIRPPKRQVERGAFDGKVEVEVDSYSNTKGDFKEIENIPYHSLPNVKEAPKVSSPRSKSSPPAQRRPKTLREVHQRHLKPSSSLESATTATTASDCSSVLTTSESEVSFLAKNGLNTTLPLESESWASFTTQADDGNYVPLCPAGVTFEVPKEWLERRKILGERQPTEPIL